MRRLAVPIILLLLFAPPRAANGQRVDPFVAALLSQGDRALAASEYHAADSLAVLLLDVPNTPRSQRIAVLQLAAAARFPETGGERYPDSAMTALRALVRFAPTARFPRTRTWHGLDSLLDLADSLTFGAETVVPDTNEVRGVAGTIGIDVFATRPAFFVLRIATSTAANSMELVDSIGPVAHGTLRITPVGGDAPRFPPGSYRILITVRDPASGETIERRYSGEFATPAVPLRHVPDTIPAGALKPEHAAPSRVRAVVSGIVLGAFSYASAQLMRNDLLKNAGSPDTRGAQWGVMLGVSTTALALYLDHGQTITSNVQANKEMRIQFAEQQQALTIANEQARRDYRATIRLISEDQ